MIYCILCVFKEVFGINRENYFLFIFFVFFVMIIKMNEEKEWKICFLCGFCCYRWNWLNMKVVKNRFVRRIWKLGNFLYFLEYVDLFWNFDFFFFLICCFNGVLICRKLENLLYVFFEVGIWIDRMLRMENDMWKML